MQGRNGEDRRVIQYIPKDTPNKIKLDVPASDSAKKVVLDGRRAIESILEGKDQRIFLIVGQCSIDDPVADAEVSRYLAELSKEVKDKILLVKRSYFEKPRTSMGWEGLIIDPKLDGSWDVNMGYRLARNILMHTVEMGLPCATEYVESQTPQYVGNLISWAAIGARTTTSQTHRKLASTLSTPVGMKNDVSGTIDTAIHGILKARESNVLPDAITDDGEPAIVISEGNPYAHLVLRGGKSGPNYGPEKVQEAMRMLEKYGLRPVVVVDCSHDNAVMKVTEKPAGYEKKFEMQEVVFESSVRQIIDGKRGTGIVSIMMEANIVPGSQKMPADLRGFDRRTLAYGQSVTDACISLDTAAKLVRDAYKML